MEEEELPLPPPPKLPPPPAPDGETKDPNSDLTEEEATMLTHLRGLVEMKVSLPEDLKQQYETLKAKEAAQASNKALGHGDINKINRLKSQAEAAAAKVKSLDAEWQKMVQDAMEKLQKHALLYKSCRAELVQKYHTKMQELAATKQSLEAASKLLLGDSGAPVNLEEPDLQAQLQAFKDNAGAVQEIMESEEEDAQQNEPGKDEEMVNGEKKVTTMKSFKPSVSPNRVAHTHLKHKPNTEKHWSFLELTSLGMEMWDTTGFVASVEQWATMRIIGSVAFLSIKR